MKRIEGARWWAWEEERRGEFGQVEEETHQGMFENEASDLGWMKPFNPFSTKGHPHRNDL